MARTLPNGSNIARVKKERQIRSKVKRSRVTSLHSASPNINSLRGIAYLSSSRKGTYAARVQCVLSESSRTQDEREYEQWHSCQQSRYQRTKTARTASGGWL